MSVMAISAPPIIAPANDKIAPHSAKDVPLTTHAVETSSMKSAVLRIDCFLDERQAVSLRKVRQAQEMPSWINQMHHAPWGNMESWKWMIRTKVSSIHKKRYAARPMKARAAISEACAFASPRIVHISFTPVGLSPSVAGVLILMHAIISPCRMLSPAIKLLLVVGASCLSIYSQVNQGIEKGGREIPLELHSRRMDILTSWIHLGFNASCGLLQLHRLALPELRGTAEGFQMKKQCFVSASALAACN